MTGGVTLRDGTTVIGTREGHVGVVRAGKLTEISPAMATGPVKDPRLIAQGPLVSFVVDQGLGIIDPRTGQQVRLAGRDLRQSRSADAAQWVSQGDGYYFVLEPQPQRPHGGPGAQFSTRLANGRFEAISLEQVPLPGMTLLCVNYVTAGGGFEHEGVCVNISDLVPPPPATPVILPTFPPGGDPCIATGAPQVDAAHQLTVDVSTAGFSPATLTINAGQTYAVTIRNTEPGVVHEFNVYDSQHNLVRDAAGVRLCVNVPAQAQGAVTVPLRIAGPARTLTYTDAIHPQVTGTLIVKAAAP